MRFRKSYCLEVVEGDVWRRRKLGICCGVYLLKIFLMFIIRVFIMFDMMMLSMVSRVLCFRVLVVLCYLCRCWKFFCILMGLLIFRLSMRNVFCIVL